jgi:hypothetical protein
VPAGDEHAQRHDPRHLAVEDVARHPVGGDPIAHHPARLGAGVADLDLVAEPSQVVGGRQATRSGPDHQHPLSAARRRRIALPSSLEREVAEEPLDGVHGDRAVEVGAVTHAFARVVTDTPMDRGQRVVGDQLTPRQLVITGLGVRQPGLDVLTSRAARVTRRQQIHVDGAPVADRPGAGAPVHEIGQRRDVRMRTGHLATPPSLAAPRDRRCAWSECSASAASQIAATPERPA